MTKLLDPATKTPPELNVEYVEEAIKQLNEARSYPVRINIGKHIMNSFTQDYIQQMIEQSGFYSVSRQMERQGRYEILLVDYTYKRALKHSLKEI